MEEYLGEETFSYNYIVLPFDTSMKMASQLCDPAVSGVPINQEENTFWWDPTTQEEIQSTRACSFITPGSPFDFELESGKVYKIIVNADANWKQK